MYLYEKAFAGSAVQVRLRRGDRVVPVPADRRDLGDQLPDRAPDQVGGVVGWRRSPTPRRARRRRYVARRFRRAGPLTYVFLLVVVLLSLFPLYWSLVVASHDNAAVSAYPPVLTPGHELFHNIQRALQLRRGQRRLLDGADQLDDRRIDVTIAVVFFSALAGFAFAKLKFRGEARVDADVVATMLVPVQLGRDPALHRDDPPRLVEPAARP